MAYHLFIQVALELPEAVELLLGTALELLEAGQVVGGARDVPAQLLHLLDALGRPCEAMPR